MEDTVDEETTNQQDCHSGTTCARSQKSGLCPRCGEKHDKQEAPCSPTCILCGGNHLTGTGSCKARTPEPRRRTVPKPKPPVPTTKDFPPLGPKQDRQRPWTKAASAPNASLRDEEVALLREE
ncbi:hypothetical protein MTO96_037490, partial [Rhipicephalus appendiculatus]